MLTGATKNPRIGFINISPDILSLFKASLIGVPLRSYFLLSSLIFSWLSGGNTQLSMSSLIFSNQFGLTLKLFPAIAGFASALSGCLFVSGAGVLTSLVGTNHNPSVFYMSLLYVGLAVFMLLLNICYKK